MKEDVFGAPMGRRYLFLFPHPDDDVFVAGMMHRLLRGGATMIGVWLTSGGAGGDAAVREREIDAAMDILGLPPDHRVLLRLPDMGLLGAMESGADLVSDLVARHRPHGVFVTGFEGGHVDHDAANFIAAEAVRRAGADTTLFEYPTYNASGTRRTRGLRINAFPPRSGDVRYARLDHDAWACKRAMIRAYASQAGVFVIERLGRSRAAMLRRGEPYRHFPATRDHRRPPLPGMVEYGRWFNPCAGISVADVAAAVEASTRAGSREADRSERVNPALKQARARIL